MTSSTNYGNNTMRQLANNSNHEDHKVGDVPAIVEVVFSECDDFDDKFHEENDDEGEVEPVQDLFCLHALIVRVHHHTHHVQADQNYHDEFKTRFGH